jgi:hypothetical protein
MRWFRSMYDRSKIDDPVKGNEEGYELPQELAKVFDMTVDQAWRDLVSVTTEDEFENLEFCEPYETIVSEILDDGDDDPDLSEALACAAGSGEIEGHHKVVFTNQWGMGVVWTTRPGAELIEEKTQEFFKSQE